MGVMSFQKIFGLYGLKCHIVETMWDVTLCDAWTKECEDKASILKAGFATNEFRGLNRLI